MHVTVTQQIFGEAFHFFQKTSKYIAATYLSNQPNFGVLLICRALHIVSTWNSTSTSLLSSKIQPPVPIWQPDRISSWDTNNTQSKLSKYFGDLKRLKSQLINIARYKNCHNDIFPCSILPGNISPCYICPFDNYISAATVLIQTKLERNVYGILFNRETIIYKMKKTQNKTNRVFWSNSWTSYNF